MKNSFLLVLFITIGQFNLLQATEFSNGIRIDLKGSSSDPLPFCATKETALLICSEAGFDFLGIDFLDNKQQLREGSYTPVQNNTECRISPKSNDFIRFRGHSNKLLNFVICHMKTAKTEFTSTSSNNKSTTHHLIYRP